MFGYQHEKFDEKCVGYQNAEHRLEQFMEALDSTLQRWTGVYCKLYDSDCGLSLYLRSDIVYASITRGNKFKLVP